MKKTISIFSITFLTLLVCIPYALKAQYGAGGVHLPYESQKASISQTIGLTNIEIVYHRPAVKGRKIWGDLVPYNNSLPWRTGANENTTISFSTDVTIEGKPLAAGTYGLHMLPTENEWTIIFSKNYTSWGSFSYDQKEDALRVTVKPQAADFAEYLTYEFPNPEPDKVTAQLHWEKLKIGFTIGVNTHEVVLASIRKELRNTPGFTWRGYDAAASYCVDENFNFDEALTWSNRAVSAEENFDDLQTLSEVQKKMGKADESQKTMDRAMIVAKPMELNGYGRQLLRQKKTDEAMKIFEYNLKQHPDQWIVYSGMARGYEAKNDMSKAIDNIKIAIEKAPESSKPGLQNLLKQFEAKK